MKTVQTSVIAGLAFFLSTGISFGAELDDIDLTIRVVESSDVSEMDNELSLPDVAGEHADDKGGRGLDQENETHGQGNDQENGQANGQENDQANAAESGPENEMESRDEREDDVANNDESREDTTDMNEERGDANEEENHEDEHERKDSLGVPGGQDATGGMDAPVAGTPEMPGDGV